MQSNSGCEWHGEFLVPRTPEIEASSNFKECSSGKKVFGSIERGLDKMKNILTPRKRLLSTVGEPRLVKARLPYTFFTDGYDVRIFISKLPYLSAF